MRAVYCVISFSLKLNNKKCSIETQIKFFGFILLKYPSKIILNPSICILLDLFVSDNDFLVIIVKYCNYCKSWKDDIIVAKITFL